MKKMFLPVIAMVLLGAAPPDEEEVPAESSAQQVPGGAGADAASTRVINPDEDYTCEREPVLTQGDDDDAEFRRQPATPNATPLFRAVDISVQGCSMLLSMSGELRPLPEVPEGIRLQPAQ